MLVYGTANVTPVFQKGKKEDSGNYRPQASIQSISRHMKDKKFSSLHGFRKGKSYLITYDEMTIMIDSGRAVDTVCLDLSNLAVSSITSS